MTAYHTTDLNNKLVQETAEEVCSQGLIGEADYANIQLQHPNTLYTPNYFIRIGLGFLTFIAVLCCGGLFGLIVAQGGMNGIVTYLVFLGLASYGTLELLVNGKKYYNAGLDNMLLFFAVAFILAACWVQQSFDQNVVASGVLMLVCCWLAYRFTDGFMAMLAYVALFAYVFLWYIKLGATAKATAPFLMMLVSALVYWLMQKQAPRKRWLYHRYCIDCITLLTLLSFNASSNYYVVRELSNTMFYPQAHDSVPMPMAWLFWAFTIIIPIAYLLYGIKEKSLLFMRTGAVLVAASIATIRYYHSILPTDIALLLSGSILIVACYLLIKYLRTPKHGFSFNSDGSEHKALQNAEALLVAQAFGNKHVDAHQPAVEFGGGSSGGGGASGSY